MYKIVKSSRSDDAPPYQGITCRIAGIESGKIYTNKQDATRDAKILSLTNPVGFKVIQIKEHQCLTG